MSNLTYCYVFYIWHNSELNAEHLWTEMPYCSEVWGFWKKSLMLTLCYIYLMKIQYIYIYAFSRRFYPKQLTIVLRLYIFCQYMCSLGIEPTTFCVADAMLYHWATQILWHFIWHFLQPLLQSSVSHDPTGMLRFCLLSMLFWKVRFIYIFIYIFLMNRNERKKHTAPKLLNSGVFLNFIPYWLCYGHYWYLINDNPAFAFLWNLNYNFI